MDTLAEASPTIKRRILSGGINRPRAAILEIAAQPVAERMKRGDLPEPEIVTKVCRSCGRELPLDRFSVRGAGHVPIYCRQYSAMACANGRLPDVREHMQTISDTVDAL